jgi:hypothetical protein
MLLAFAPARADLVGISFTGTWGGTLGPITAGDTISATLTWDQTTTTNACVGNPAYTICRPLASLSLTETPNTDGLSISSLTNTSVLFASALYVGAAGTTFDGIQINDRAADCTTLSGACFGVFFVGPSFAGFQNLAETESITTSRFSSSGISPVPEPRGTVALLVLCVLVGLPLRRRFSRSRQRSEIGLVIR